MSDETSRRTKSKARFHTWLTEPLPADVKRAIDRLKRAQDVRHIALMPDVHLAEGVCIGTVMATRRLIYPQAVGADIGCGMAAVAFNIRSVAADSGGLD